MKIERSSPLEKSFKEVKEIIDRALDCLPQLSRLSEKIGSV